MISFMKGRVAKIGQDFLCVDVNGIGYKIFTSTVAIGQVRTGEAVRLHTKMIVKEDSISLFGFIQEDELFLFEKLITVSGIGPKAAIAVLSCMSPADFACLVVDGRVEELMKIPGIGRKTGERLILELKDKLERFDGGYIYDEGPDSRREAMEALVSLGFDAAHVHRVLSGIEDDKADTAQLIRLCLKGLKS
jgi:Holliday junction DNA helicase RuvA